MWSIPVAVRVASVAELHSSTPFQFTRHLALCCSHHGLGHRPERLYCNKFSPQAICKRESGADNKSLACALVAAWLTPPAATLTHEITMKNFTSPLWLVGVAAALFPYALFAKGTITGQIESRELREVSGIAASRINPGVVWLHNDGRTNRLFGVRTTGETAAVLEWPNAMVDFEDAASGPGPTGDEAYLYIGDIGDNDARRPQVRVYRVLEPKLADSDGPQYLTGEVEDFRFTYPEGPVDAEALLVDPVMGDILIVSKEKKRAQVFAIAQDQLKPREPVELQHVATIKIGNVSAGDISPDGRQIMLRSEKDGWLWQRDPAKSVGETLSQPGAVKVPVRHKAQAKNGEGISFDPAGDGYFTISEGSGQPLALFPLYSE